MQGKLNINSGENLQQNFKYSMEWNKPQNIVEIS